MSQTVDNTSVTVSDFDSTLQLSSTYAIVETEAPSTVTTAPTVDARSAAVRRPHRGIEIKKETYAYIEVVGSAGSTIANSSTPNSVSFTSNITITGVSQARAEKMQPVLTFGQDYLYFFGHQPIEMTFTGLLLNTANFRWEEEWWHNYDNYFRGTKLVGRSQKILIGLEEYLIYGYMSGCSTQKDANNPYIVNLTFTIHVSDIISTREGKIGSNNPNDQKETLAGDVDQFLLDASGNIIENKYTTYALGADSKAIREYNITKYNQPGTEVGALTKYKNSIKEGFSALSAATSPYIDFIYGRNIVIPAGVTEFSVGNATYAGFLVKSEQGVLTVIDSVVAASRIDSFTSSYNNNLDEYPMHMSTIAMPSPAEQVTNAEDVLSITAVDPAGVRKIQNINDTARKAAFAVFQIGVAQASSAARRNAFKEAAANPNNPTLYRYPNEVFSIGAAANPYFARGNT